MSGFRRFRLFSSNFTRFSRQFSNVQSKKVINNQWNKYLVILGGGIALIAYQKWKNIYSVQALQLRKVCDKIDF